MTIYNSEQSRCAILPHVSIGAALHGADSSAARSSEFSPAPHATLRPRLHSETFCRIVDWRGRVERLGDCVGLPTVRKSIFLFKTRS